MKYNRNTESMFRPMLKRGGIVGVVDVVDCVRTHRSEWKFRESWGWSAIDPRPLARGSG
jgi:hypothetical protein